MNRKANRSILGVSVNMDPTNYILENIKKGLLSQRVFTHVVSLNPENIVLTLHDDLFKRIVLEAEITINDGIGIVLASQMLFGSFVPRLTGVELMQKLINEAANESLRVLLIGGNSKLAEELADCYSRSYPASKFKGIVGFKDIKHPTSGEQKEILSIVTALRPHLIFVAFGSPYQEKWIYENRASLQGITCIGVGGAFDFLSGRVARAPKLIQSIGLEWLYRLMRQPWRWRRQLQLPVFIYLVLKQKFSRSEG
ncbi:WecB/TagA/CpsF family glycosyltransferase [Candidatus Woesebacteria bacterium]|jgi:N-acetylglucosaminyldiphosphoundecaprenol N-acetyl-beta-D-mannosaminyltransferase|nr:WecB/TagA/CpsF family glycosyltransferase [Candidatus Woesebacteria bacterium]MBP6883142.1 WecB/TagA/CpsF family glycosyltransferase [Candidatus Woesebacteria bacterium]